MFDLLWMGAAAQLMLPSHTNLRDARDANISEACFKVGTASLKKWSALIWLTHIGKQDHLHI
jgi:hypothetical protein